MTAFMVPLFGCSEPDTKVKEKKSHDLKKSFKVPSVVEN